MTGDDFKGRISEINPPLALRLPPLTLCFQNIIWTYNHQSFRLLFVLWLDGNGTAFTHITFLFINPNNYKYFIYFYIMIETFMNDSMLTFTLPGT